MAIGPFNSFAFPGVYTQTLNEPPRVSAAGALRFPAFIGVGDEVTAVTAYEMIRGSSSMADNQITKEDVSSQVLGTNRDFTVTFKPITTGAGTGTVATDPRSVIAYVNGDPAPVASIDGANGIVYLMSIPALGDTIEMSYYYKKTDTLHTDEDVSVQANGTNKVFKVDYVPIVSGNNGGQTTTDPTKVTFKVNGSAVSVSAVDGDSGQITLSSTTTAPASTDTVTVTYYSNEYQDTSDILPSDHVASITKVGYSSTSQDFIDTVDYVLDTTGAFNTLNWGNSYKIAYGSHTAGSTYLYSQISGTLYDNHIFRRPTTGTVDGTNTSFVLGYVPTLGTGQGKTTDDPSKISVYVGVNPDSVTDATVLELSGSSKTVTLKTPPTVGQNVYVTQYHNMLPDDTWTLENLADGTYSVTGTSTGVAWNIVQLTSPPDTTVADPDFGTEGVTYPAGTGVGNSDAQVVPGYGVSEKVSLTFADSTKYIVTSDNPAGTGTAGDNTGYLNQTYIDGKTGFRVTVNTGASVTYTAGDKIGYQSSSSITTGVTPTRAIPGIRVTVTSTTGVTVGDTGLLTTYNKSGSEPNIGDFYYVSFLDNKEFNDDNMVDPVFVTLEKDALSYSGSLTINNKLGLAAHMAFLNGAPAMALLQIQKTSGGTDAPDSEYIAGIDEFNSPMENGLRPSLMEPVTTTASVLSYLKTSNTIQSSIRYANERMSYFGFANNTSPSAAMVYAQSMNNERMTAIYPDGGIITITDELGNNSDYVVDGSLLAAAIAGRDTAPAFDVAEPLTRKPVAGFTRLFRRLDTVTQAQICNAGVTLLEEQPAGIIIKMDLTTDVSSVLTRTPSVIKIKDFVQKGSRDALNQYIGSKYLPSRLPEIEGTLTSYLGSLVQAQIIQAYTGVKATQNTADPTTVDVLAYYAPVLPLLWIVITFNLRSSV